MRGGRVLLRVTKDGYVPADDDARAQHAKLKLGDVVAAHVSRPRSLPQNKLYWAILQHVAEASYWETPERLHVALKVRLGYFDLMQMPNGKMVPVVHSASFDAMNQDEFQTYMDRAVKLICEDVLGGMDSADLIAEVQTMLGASEAA